MNEYFIKRPLALWWLTALIILSNIALFVVEALGGVSISNPANIDLIGWGADFTPLTLGAEPWRLLSSMFLHIGFLHLLINMWALYLFGLYAEFYYPRWFYIATYLIAGIAGGLTSNYLSIEKALQVSTQTASALPMVSASASGAIMGIGATLLVAALWPRSGLNPAYRLNQNAIIMLMLINLGIGVFISGINSADHLGGFIAGLIMAYGFRASLLLPRAVQLSAQLALTLICACTCYWVYQYLVEIVQPLLALWSQ